MRLALTGGTGFVGLAVLHSALQQGFAVNALRRPQTCPLTLPPADGLIWINGDIRDDEVWTRLLGGCDAVIHLAAPGVLNLDNARHAVETDIPALVSLMEASTRLGFKRIVLAGSCFEYGRTGEEISGRGLRIDDRLQPVNLTDLAKSPHTRLLGPCVRRSGWNWSFYGPFTSMARTRRPAG